MYCYQYHFSFSLISMMMIQLLAGEVLLNSPPSWRGKIKTPFLALKMNYLEENDKLTEIVS